MAYRQSISETQSMTERLTLDFGASLRFGLASIDNAQGNSRTLRQYEANMYLVTKFDAGHTFFGNLRFLYNDWNNGRLAGRRRMALSLRQPILVRTGYPCPEHAHHGHARRPELQGPGRATVHQLELRPGIQQRHVRTARDRDMGPDSASPASSAERPAAACTTSTRPDRSTTPAPTGSTGASSSKPILPRSSPPSSATWCSATTTTMRRSTRSSARPTSITTRNTCPSEPRARSAPS